MKEVEIVYTGRWGRKESDMTERLTYTHIGTKMGGMNKELCHIIPNWEPAVFRVSFLISQTACYSINIKNPVSDPISLIWNPEIISSHLGHLNFSIFVANLLLIYISSRFPHRRLPILWQIPQSHFYLINSLVQKAISKSPPKYKLPGLTFMVFHSLATYT